MIKHQLYLGLGSNLGDRERNLTETIRLIGERIGEVVRQSSFIETEPWGFQSDNCFMNAVILCLTEKKPREVLALTQQIERDMGKCKEHATQRSQIVNGKSSNCKYADRPIDIDILLYDDWTVDEPDLKIPHPLMHQRDFVMIPLKQITNTY
jgi:2-amino-4-hydroxy-6-hydroxymethyldihydropteridine diphosphokinase